MDRLTGDLYRLPEYAAKNYFVFCIVKSVFLKYLLRAFM